MRRGKRLFSDVFGVHGCPYRAKKGVRVLTIFPRFFCVFFFFCMHRRFFYTIFLVCSFLCFCSVFFIISTFSSPVLSCPAHHTHMHTQQQTAHSTRNNTAQHRTGQHSTQHPQYTADRQHTHNTHALQRGVVGQVVVLWWCFDQGNKRNQWR